MIFAGTRGYLDALPVNVVQRFEKEFLSLLHGSHTDLLDEIREKKELTKDIEQKLKDVLDKFSKTFAV